MEKSLKLLQKLLDITNNQNCVYLHAQLNELKTSIVQETILITRIHEN